MRVGFVVDEKGYVSVNALTDASNLKELAKSDAQDEGVEVVALLIFDDFKSESRGDLGDAFEALRSLIGINAEPGSLCYAVEEMLEQVFEAGRKYEREHPRRVLPVHPVLVEMKDEALIRLGKAMDVASVSIANLKRFTEILDTFLKVNGLGSAEYSADYPAVDFRADTHGYTIAMFHLRDVSRKDVIYFYVYSDGTVQGENFSDAPGLSSNLSKGCTYTEAAQEVLETIGVMNHSAIVNEKINKAIEALRS